MEGHGSVLHMKFVLRISKREKYSRRRIYDDDADINFINERNMKFNKKLERFYGDYTEEIKQNLERGTAVWVAGDKCSQEVTVFQQKYAYFGPLGWSLFGYYLL